MLAYLTTLMLGNSTVAEPSKVMLVKQSESWQLLRDGKPFYIKGAGGDASAVMLAEAGGNSFRTWGVGDDTQARLDEAQRIGLGVTLGIWLGHERHGFNYDDPAQVRKQFDDAKAAVMRFKDHPAVLLWAVGNEREGYESGDNPKIWKAVNDIAAMIKQLDPNHPTLTVTAEIGGGRVKAMHELCPAIDIVGINSYGGVRSIPQRYRAAGGTKPYIVTEFGPPGSWEVGANGWGVPEELTSTQKAAIYKAAYQSLEADPLNLGSYAFTWGSKQEATATWFGMFMPDGTKLAAVDAMTECWTGKPPANLCPEIRSMTVTTGDVVEPGQTVRVALDVADPEGKAVKVDWVLFQEMDEFFTGGDHRPAPPTFPGAIVAASGTGVELKMPARPGNYRVFAYVRDADGGGAVANKPLKVEGQVNKSLGQHANLPLVIYGDNMTGTPYIASGYMGDHAAIKMNEKSAQQPHSGETCLEVKFNQSGGWGGVVWQSPANDWGDQPGGFDLTGAQSLSFWARGGSGGEKVKFGFGLIGREKPHFDTGKAEIELQLTAQWKQYVIDLSNKDLACIKSGFFWVVGGQGQPVIFYLDDIVYTGVKGEGAAGGSAVPVPVAQLPLTLIGDGMGDPPYIPSGYMGDHAAIRMDDKAADQPHSGETCLEVKFNQAGGWGGVVWQSPANDWGDQPGGFDLSGATRLTFWARGAAGGEKVKFGFGLIDHDKPFFDSGKGEREVTLSTQWQQVTIDLTGKNLGRIKSGFYWALTGRAAPVTFYLDDLRYE